MTSEKPRVLIAVYREITEGDMRKLLATSNDNPADGGGARDLRFPAVGFDEVLRGIFTRDAVGARGRPIRQADITYRDENGDTRTTVLDYWHIPTRSRPTETRIAQVHDSPALGGGKLPDGQRGRVFVLFTKFSDGIVRVDYAYENDLRTSGVWADEIRFAILHCLDVADRKNKKRSSNLIAAQGHYDFQTGSGYCHGK